MFSINYQVLAQLYWIWSYSVASVLVRSADLCFEPVAFKYIAWMLIGSRRIMYNLGQILCDRKENRMCG